MHILAEEFLGELQAFLAASSGGDVRLARMSLDETDWPDIIDAARTAPFLFEPWRAIVVRVPERKPASERPAARDGGEGPAPRHLGPAGQKLLREYFADPPSRTVLVVIRAGKVRRDDALVRFFASLPKAAFSAVEMKRLKEKDLMRRADERARALGKTLSEGAKRRLFELVGQDLRLTVNEVDKLAVFAGEKKGIDEEDVDEATAGQRAFEPYALDDALVAADFAAGAAVLNDLLAEGERPEQIVGRLAGFFRNVLTAKAWLAEKSRTRDEVFQAFFPYISKSWSDLYGRKFRGFFGVVEGLAPAELNALLAKLRQLDWTIKNTSAKDCDYRALFEAFLRELCLAREKKAVTPP